MTVSRYQTSDQVPKTIITAFPVTIHIKLFEEKCTVKDVAIKIFCCK